MGACTSKGLSDAQPDHIAGKPQSPVVPVMSGLDKSPQRRPSLSAAAAAMAAASPASTCRKGPSASPSPSSVHRQDRKSETIKSSQFILDNPGNIHEVYCMGDRCIGEGTYGSVVRSTHKATKKVRAIKIIAKAQLKSVDRFKREVGIMKLLDHPNIIKLFETFEDGRAVYMAMELCTGGELFNRIIESQRLTEREAATVTQQILRAIKYIHDQGVVHRDLKPDNFLFATKDPIEHSTLKIIDFGLSSMFKPGQMLSSRVGTPYYVAPEVLVGSYDNMCDLWSIGVIAYILICGYPPFHGRSDQEVLARVRKGIFVFEEKDWGRISGDAKSLIRELLCYGPKKRATAERSLGHEWIKQKAPRTSAVALRSMAGLIGNFTNFRTESILKKAALQIIAGQLEENQLKGLRDTFTALDANGDGLLTLDEIKCGLDQAGIQQTQSDLQDVVNGMDTDGNGVVDYTEFLAAALDKRQYLSDEACWTAFKVFDLDDDGRITLDELRKILHTNACDGHFGDISSADELFEDVDRNGDGMIDFSEFMIMMAGKV